MKRYLRFGEIPAGGRSINFMKLSFNQNSSFHYSISGGFVESAYAKIPESALEPGISCFDLDADGNPVLDNIRLVCSFCARLGGGKDCDGVPIMPEVAYIIEGSSPNAGTTSFPASACGIRMFRISFPQTSPFRATTRMLYAPFTFRSLLSNLRILQ